MKTHILKTEPTCWDAVAAGEKCFEVRKNDRFYQRDDLVELVRWEPPHSFLRSNPFLGLPKLTFRIGWILQGGQFGIDPGYVVFQLEPAEGEELGHEAQAASVPVIDVERNPWPDLPPRSPARQMRGDRG